MKKKIIIILAVFAVLGCGIYLYMYKDHRDIASESANFTVTVKQLTQQFSENAAQAGKQYADKTLEVSGTVTTVDLASHSVVIDEKLSAVFNDSVLEGVIKGKPIKIKGRFVGYDDLLEELKMDQASITE